MPSLGGGEQDTLGTHISIRYPRAVKCLHLQFQK